MDARRLPENNQIRLFFPIEWRLCILNLIASLATFKEHTSPSWSSSKKEASLKWPSKQERGEL